MRRLFAICAAATLPLVGCGGSSHAGCYVYLTGNYYDKDTYIMIVDSPSDAHVDWEATAFPQDDCESIRQSGWSGRTAADLRAAVGK